MNSSIFQFYFFWWKNLIWFVIYTSLMGTFSPRAAVSTDLRLLYVSASYYQSPDWWYCTIFHKMKILDEMNKVFEFFNKRSRYREKCWGFGIINKLNVNCIKYFINSHGKNYSVIFILEHQIFFNNFWITFILWDTGHESEITF